MNRLLLIICFQLIFRAICVSHELPEALKMLDGMPITYCSQGAETYAIHLQKLLNTAIHYFDTATNESVDVELIVLNKGDASSMNVQWPMPFSTDNPNRIFMPNQGYIEVQLGDHLKSENQFHISDFIAIHELGHILWHKRLGWHEGQPRFKNHKWIGEFIADYYMMGYLIEVMGVNAFPESSGSMFTYLPFRYKTLIDFELQYSKLPKTNYVGFQAKFSELAFTVFNDKGWSFVSELDQLYDSLANKEGLDRRASFPVVNDHIASISADSADWFKGLKNTPHPILMFMGLFGMITISIIGLRKTASIYKLIIVLILSAGLSGLLIFSVFYLI
ncbi:MAG: hypothetical protein JXQ90_19175 [Cyclobacteriaceae bacterium]